MKQRVSPGIDRIARYAIIVIGIVCFALLAWDHLGLGAWLFPPAQSATTQTAFCGAGTITLTAPIHLSATQSTIFTFEVKDQDGRPITGATLSLQPQMIAMAMNAQTVYATPDGDGHYRARLRLGMAGNWRLAILLARPGRPSCVASFNLGVRW